MTTIPYVAGSSRPVVLKLEQDDGSPAVLSGVQLHIQQRATCHKLAATLTDGVWTVLPEGIGPGLHRAQVWWDDAGGLTTDAGAYFLLHITEVC